MRFFPITNNNARTGSSLMEVIIAMGIFVTLMVGIMQALISTRSFIGEDEIRNDLELESARIIGEMTNDLGNSAWFLKAPEENMPEPRTKTPMSYPNVGKGADNESLGTTAWGDQIDFLRLRTKDGTWNSPFEMRNDLQIKARQNLSTSDAVDMDKILDARTFTSLVVNPKWLPGFADPYVWPVFESAVAPLSYVENSTLQFPSRSPRLYRYIVREIPGTQNGRLVRQYSNGPGSDYGLIPEHAQKISSKGEFIPPPPVSGSPNPWVDDVILTDNIKATNDPDYPDLIGVPGVSFDTLLTDSSIKFNEVRIKLILVKRPSVGDSGLRFKRLIQTSVTMRSVSFK